MMNSLKVSLLPSVRTNEDSAALQMEREGFVDEAAVLALLSGPSHLRSISYPEDLALAADDLDFAGWQIPTMQVPVSRPAEFPPQVIDAIVRRASPPSINESGIGSPHHGSHRWWLAGLAGAFSTLLFSVLLASLSSRQGLNPEPAPSPGVASHSSPAALHGTSPAPSASPELTKISSLRP